MTISTTFAASLCLVVTLVSGNVVAATEDFSHRLARGAAYRQQGNLLLSIEALEQARRIAETPAEQALADGELGASYLAARQHSAALSRLKIAYQYFTGQEKARYALDLGNLSVTLKNKRQAMLYYQQAQKLAGNNDFIRVTAILNEMRLDGTQRTLPKLKGIAETISVLGPGADKIRLALNLGNQAMALGSDGTSLAFRMFQQSIQLAEASRDVYLQAFSYDALAQLYESQQREEDALELSNRGIRLATTSDDNRTASVLINLFWRQGRIASRKGDNQLALSAYQAAVEQIESIRQDIPVEYDGDQSSFRDTLEPIYLGLAEQLLRLSDRSDGNAQQGVLRRVRGVVELIKQTEMQDYLGERCSVDATRSSEDIRAEARTGVVYPIIFPDRLELLLETTRGMSRKTVPVSSANLRQTIRSFAEALREGPDSSLAGSTALYDWLIRPLESDLSQAAVETLVIVPDGVIRMLPFAAMSDGQKFLIQKYALTIAPGLTMTNAPRGEKRSLSAVLAGLSNPGPVVEKLPAKLLDRIVPNTGERSLRTTQESLRLPGVKDEIDDLSKKVSGYQILDDNFTLQNFRQSVETEGYNIVHIASHGVFGGKGEQSYILTYDELLTMDTMQSILRSENAQRHLSLLTLSACETAEGDERAPLGLAGAALKAKADSVLGTLWPVNDDAAKQVMSGFYQGYVVDRMTKAGALRKAQQALISGSTFRHPYYWAPFIVVGNWQ